MSLVSMQIAIEYYIHEDARKALYFQKKLATLLADPQTLKLI